MSKISDRKGKTIGHFSQAKAGGQKISAITCYDSSHARLLNQTDVDLVLVGDSLGNVILGYDNTIPVTLQDILHHTRAVSRVLESAFLCADMPFLSYNISSEQALENAGKLMQEGRCHSVKLEGGMSICPQVEKLTSAGIPVLGHLGFTPQSLHQIGGYRVQGRGDDGEQLLADALALQEAGAFAIVLEMVPKNLAKTVTDRLTIPTIGIGAGSSCDGQIIVLHDILGYDPGFKPKFLKRYAQLGETIVEAVNQYDTEVKSGEFPTDEHSFKE